jgi:hypothetical protein
MKPGSVQTQLDPTITTPPVDEVHEVQRVDAKKERVNIDELPLVDKSQLPEVPASRTESPGESPLVKGRVGAEESGTKKGKRQKLLKVLDVKALSKTGKTAFKDLEDVLGKAVQRLLKRKDAAAHLKPEDA